MSFEWKPTEVVSVPFHGVSDVLGLTKELEYYRDSYNDMIEEVNELYMEIDDLHEQIGLLRQLLYDAEKDLAREKEKPHYDKYNDGWLNGWNAAVSAAITFVKFKANYLTFDQADRLSIGMQKSIYRNGVDNDGH